MRRMSRLSLERGSTSLFAFAVASIALFAAPAQAQSAASDGRTPEEKSGEDRPVIMDEIVVTAQKREQSLNDVGLSINAISGDDLQSKRITDPEDLVRVVPGFTYTRSQFDFPTYTIRGVGFYESSLAAAPTVSVYVDQVPLPYPAMTRGAILDLERLEVLKGPQGTLFGQNSTGGAINYIAAKPTDVLSAGATLSYGRFNTFEAEGFISGPLSDTVTARIAAKTVQSGDYQKSATRPGDTLGEKHFSTGRFLLDFEPSETLRFSLNLNGWIDRSDTQAAQVAEVTPVVAGLPVPPTVASSALTSFSPRIADWNPELDLERDNRFYQASLRADLDLTEDITLTSISAYQHYDQYAFQDTDGTPARNLHLIPSGSIGSFSQEIRFAGQSFDKRLNWIVGANYQNDKVHDNQVVFLDESTGSVTPFGNFAIVVNDSRSRIKNLAIFANADFSINDRISVVGGIRYTNTKSSYNACSLDSGAGDLSTIFQLIQQFALSVPVTAEAGECVTLLDTPGTPASQVFSTGRYSDSLTEDNISWRLGVNWKPFENDTLLYANVSQGYKSGSFPTVSAQLASQLTPATQEKLVAYEIGFKAPLADRRVQLNGAAFYYDYSDKQLRGRIQTFFGQLEKLVNIPDSRIWGGELQLTARPTSGLTLNAAASYVNSKILRNPDGSAFLAFPQRTHGQVPVSGEAFPFTPEWTLTGDAEYRWGLSAGTDAFFGGGATYQSRTKSGLESADPSRPIDVSDAATATYNDPALAIPSYVLLDLRAGIEAKDGRWKVSVWGKNITNKYYIVNTLKIQDTLVRYAGSPASYGITFGYRF